MVKKSFLGRFFGKKKAEPKSSKPKEAVKASKQQASTATATATPKKEAATLTQRKRPQSTADDRRMPKSPAMETKSTNRISEKKAPTPEQRPKGGGNGKQAVKEKKPASPILEPEILSRTEKMASESREQIDVIARKMSTQEEVSVKISNGIKGLSNVLSNIDQRLEEQTQQSFEIARTVKTIPEMIEDLPESSRAGVELLHSISQILENQSAATKDLGKQISGLPDALTDLKTHLDKDVDERTKDRVAVQETVDSMKTTIDQLEERNTQLSKQQEDSTNKLVDSLQQTNNDHQRQIDALMEKGQSTNRLLLYILYVVVIGMIIIVSII